MRVFSRIVSGALAGVLATGGVGLVLPEVANAAPELSSNCQADQTTFTDCLPDPTFRSDVVAALNKADGGARKVTDTVTAADAELEFSVFPSAAVASLKGLEFFKGLTSFSRGLSFQRLENLTSLEGLQDHPKLTTVDVWMAPVTSLKGIEGNTALTTLELSSANKLSGIEGLRGLPLKRLSLTSGSLTSIDGLSDLGLDINGNPVEPQLEDLYLRDNLLTTIPDLSAFPRLQTVDLSGNMITVPNMKLGEKWDLRYQNGYQKAGAVAKLTGKVGDQFDLSIPMLNGKPAVIDQTRLPAGATVDTATGTVHVPITRALGEAHFRSMQVFYTYDDADFNVNASNFSSGFLWDYEVTEGSATFLNADGTEIATENWKLHAWASDGRATYLIMVDDLAPKGQTFDHWEDVKTGQEVTFPRYNDGTDWTLKAVYRPAQIGAVDFKDADGKLLSTWTGKYGDQIDAPADPVPADPKLVFAGWVDGDGKPVSFPRTNDGSYIAVTATFRAEYPFVRYQGKSRYGTAALANSEHAVTGGVAFIATGENFPDALSISPAVVSQKGALYLADGGDGLNATELDLLKQQKPSEVVLVGGTVALPHSVETQIAAALGQGGPKIDRVKGVDRYATSVAIAQKYFGQSQVALVATGLNYPDALSAGPVASSSSTQFPIILVDGKQASALTEDQKGLVMQGGALYILGGGVAIQRSFDQGVQDQGFYTQRIEGTDRYETSYKLAEIVKSMRESDSKAQTAPVWVATGEGFADALVASSIAGRTASPVILAPVDQPSEFSEKALALFPSAFVRYAMGGTQVLSDASAKVGLPEEVDTRVERSQF